MKFARSSNDDRKLSVVIPIYNEEANIPMLFALDRHWYELGREYELLSATTVQPHRSGR